MPRKPRRNIPPQAPTGRPYGEGQKLAQAQQAIPLQPAGPTTPQAAPAPPTPVVPLDAPTMRPNEPVTAGLPLGPGAGPEALSPNYFGIADDNELEIRELIARYPQYQTDLARLLDYFD